MLMGDLSLFARLPHISAAVASAKIAVQLRAHTEGEI